MDPAGIPALHDAIRYTEGCESTHVETVHVHERQGDETVWEGDVEVFELIDHAKARRAIETAAERARKPVTQWARETLLKAAL